MTTPMTLWNGRSVPRIGLGCWAIGGTTRNDGPSTSYGEVDDAQSRRALKRGYELGARVFDTAASYGAGHSEMLVGEEISQFNDAVIVTKFGYEVDFEGRRNGPENVTPDGIRKTIEGSRKRLRRDTLDLALLHINTLDIEAAKVVFDTLAELRTEGKIAAFGWSTDFVERASAFADLDGFVAVENDYNVFTPAEDLMALFAEKGLVSISRLPLAMGLLTGKYQHDAKIGKDDVRAQAFDWLRFFRDGKPSAECLKRIEVLRDLLQTGGRSLPQGALGWILAKSPVALPVPGFKSVAQVEDNLGALDKGPLPAAVMAEIDGVLKSFERGE